MAFSSVKKLAALVIISAIGTGSLLAQTGELEVTFNRDQSQFFIDEKKNRDFSEPLASGFEMNTPGGAFDVSLMGLSEQDAKTLRQIFPTKKEKIKRPCNALFEIPGELSICVPDGKSDLSPKQAIKVGRFIKEPGIYEISASSNIQTPKAVNTIQKMIDKKGAGETHASVYQCGNECPTNIAINFKPFK